MLQAAKGAELYNARKGLFTKLNFHFVKAVEVVADSIVNRIREISIQRIKTEIKRLFFKA